MRHRKARLAAAPLAWALALAAPGDNNLGVSRAHEDQDGYDLVWDEATGTVGDKGYAVFTVNDGRVVMGAPGQTNALDGICWIGSRTQKSTRLDIVGGTVDHQGNWFCISRGAGRTAGRCCRWHHGSTGAPPASRWHR